MGEFTPVQEKQREKAAEKYGIKNNDYWYLELLFTNPDDEGRGKYNFTLERCPALTVNPGHCGKLLRAFEAYEPTKLLMLNAASERSISIYHHYGWKVRARSNSTPVQLNVPQTFAQHMLGVGKVAEDGTAAKGEKAKGVLLELMVKVRDAPQVYAPCVC